MSILVKVKCDSDTQLYWQKDGESAWTQLSADRSQAPTIDTTGQRATYEFVQDASSTHTILYKPDSGGTSSQLPTAGGPTKLVDAGDRSLTYFAKNDSTPNWYVGYVTVSEDR